jgi:alpha-ribazole phosphatase
MNVTLYLVRHGAIVEENEKRYIGQTDVSLSERGAKQASALGDWLRQHDFTRIFCSDLTRARHSAEIILGERNLSIDVHSELREINLGEWDGVSFREIEAKYPDEFKARGGDIEAWRPPGGESFADCRRRVLGFLNSELAGCEGNVLLVAHAGVNRIILCEALGLPTAKLMHLGQDYGCVNIVEFGRNGARVQLLNFVPVIASESGPLEATHRRGTSAL